MDKNDEGKKRKRPPHDFWDDFFGRSFNEFMSIQKDMDKFFHESMKSFSDVEKRNKPFVYGFTFRMGPDGVPHFEQFGDTKFGRPGFGQEEKEDGREPLTDIQEVEDHIAITMELPGVEKEDIDLEIFEHSLTINVDTEERKYHKKIKLPDNLDPSSVKATCKNGVLDIVINRQVKKPKKGKRIKIN